MIACESGHKFHVRVCHLAKEPDRLLPFATARDVAVIAAPEGEDGKQVSAVTVIAPQPAPRQIIGAREINERRGAKLRVLTEKACDLERVKIADYAKAAAPRVAV